MIAGKPPSYIFTRALTLEGQALKQSYDFK